MLLNGSTAVAAGDVAVANSDVAPLCPFDTPKFSSSTLTPSIFNSSLISELVNLVAVDVLDLFDVPSLVIPAISPAYLAIVLK